MALIQTPLNIQQEPYIYRMTFIYTEGPLNIKKGADFYIKEGSYIYTEGSLYKRRVLVYKESPSI